MGKLWSLLFVIFIVVPAVGFGALIQLFDYSEKHQWYETLGVAFMAVLIGLVTLLIYGYGLMTSGDTPVRKRFVRASPKLDQQVVVIPKKPAIIACAPKENTDLIDHFVSRWTPPKTPSSKTNHDTIYGEVVGFKNK